MRGSKRTHRPPTSSAPSRNVTPSPRSALDREPAPLHSRAERTFLIRVISYDWNCPKYITPRFTQPEVEKLIAPLKTRIAELEAELAKRPPA